VKRIFNDRVQGGEMLPKVCGGDMIEMPRCRNEDRGPADQQRDNCPIQLAERDPPDLPPPSNARSNAMV
jgi:hypothetical protein